MNTTHLTNRNGIWLFARRVPTLFAEFDRRGIVKQSTKIRVADDPRALRAGRIAEKMNSDLEAYWFALSEGNSADAQRRYEAAKIRARMMGFDYAPMTEVARRPLDEVVERVERLVELKTVDDPTAVAAILGAVPPPQFKLSTLFDEFAKLQRASLRDLSPDQMRKWGNPKKRALANFIEQVGDKELLRITRGDALDFQSWWQDRVLDEDLEIGTANKDFGHINAMLKVIESKHRLGLAPVFSDLRIAGETTGQRVAYHPDFVQGTLLKEGMLNDVNDEARRAVYLIAETGLRLSEAVNLTRDTINLDAPVPYVMVRPDGRRMKTEQSERDVPLVGVALKAMQQQPDGFPRYRDKAASLSALINKVFRNRGLRPEPGQSIYSLRHTFEDRLTAIEAPEKMIAMLMGHKFGRPKYGVGPSLEQKQRWLQRMAFTSPESV